MLSALTIALLINVRLTFAEMSGGAYEIESDSINNMGNNSTSENYEAFDSGGETATGDSSGDDYTLKSGLWQTTDYYLAMSCPVSLLMGAIVGSGKSDPTLANNLISCNIKTDNPGGYSLMWKASSVNMANGGNTVASYAPDTAGVPETWDVAATNSAWGGRLGTASTTTNTASWGTADSYSSPAKWLNVPVSDYTLVARDSETATAGDDEIIYFGAEFGSSKVQPTGTYSVDITITATTL